MRHTLRITALLTLLAFSTAAWSTEKLRVGHDLWVGFSGVFLAQDLGYFTEAGLEIDLRGFPGPGDSIPPLLAGHLDISLTTLHNLALIAGLEDDSIAAIYFLDASHGADAIVARDDIPDVAALRGKRIAVTLNEANHILLILALERAGLTEADVQLVNLSGDDAGAAFLAGRVDAAITWEPWVTRALSAGDGTVIFSTRDAPDTIVNTISVRREALAEKADAFAAFIGAVDRGVAYLQENPEKAIAIIARWLEADPADIAGMLEGDEIFRLADNRRLFGDSDGSGIQALDTVITFLHERGLIQRRPSAQALTDDRFIP